MGSKPNAENGCRPQFRLIDSGERIELPFCARAKLAQFLHCIPNAEVAELADAQDSKSCDPCGHEGSTPSFGTTSNPRR